MYQDTKYGVSVEKIQLFKKLTDQRKNAVFKTSSEITFSVSNGITMESHYEDGEPTLIEINAPCEVQIKITQTKVSMKIFSRSDTRKIQNLIRVWRVKYFCRDFISRGVMEEEIQQSNIKIFVGPNYSSDINGQMAKLDESHFASEKSVLILKCFGNEWSEANKNINIMFQNLPMAAETIKHEDSVNSSASTEEH